MVFYNLCLIELMYCMKNRYDFNSGHEFTVGNHDDLATHVDFSSETCKLLTSLKYHSCKVCKLMNCYVSFMCFKLYKMTQVIAYGFFLVVIHCHKYKYLDVYNLTWKEGCMTFINQTKHTYPLGVWIRGR